MKRGLGFAVLLVMLAYNYHCAVILIKDCKDEIPLVVVLVLICTIALSAPSAYFTRTQAKNVVGNRFNKVDHCFLLLQFSRLIFCVIGRECVAMLKRHAQVFHSTHIEILNTIAVSLIPVQIMFPALDMFDEEEHGYGILTYCPAIVDIYEGIEMSETKLNAANPVWMEIMICLAVLMVYIPSFLEIYYLRFPQLTNGPILSKRKIRFAHFVFSCMYLVLRVVLFAYNPHEIGFVIKSFITVYSHYKVWSNDSDLHSKAILKQATEISREIALSLANQRLSLYSKYFMWKNKDRKYNEVHYLTSDMNTSLNHINRQRSLSV